MRIYLNLKSLIINKRPVNFDDSIIGSSVRIWQMP